MPKSPKTPNLTLVPPQSNTLAPPASLGEAGVTLWRSIQAEYDVADSPGLAILTQVCAAADTVKQCEDTIAQDGPTIRTKTGIKEHPLFKVQTASRALIIRGLARLNLDVEPTRASVGRPPGSYTPTRP
jgi:Phage terminase, small subunit